MLSKTTSKTLNTSFKQVFLTERRMPFSDISF